MAWKPAGIRLKQTLTSLDQDVARRARENAALDIVAKCRRHVDAAINTLLRIMRDPKARDIARIKAAALIIERGYGKADINLNVAHHYNADQLEQAARAILAKRQIAAVELKAGSAPVVIDAKLDDDSNGETGEGET